MTLTQLFTSIANAIRSKKGTSALIQAEDFASEISSISTGTDTSDATATNINIKEGETAYARGSKITGTLPVLRYPTNPSRPSDTNYQFIAATASSLTTRDGINYLVGTYQIAAQNEPDSWMFEGNRKMKLGIPYSTIVSKGNITASKIMSGYTIYGVQGTAGEVKYTELQYITSDGNQYVDTGFIPSASTRFYIKASTQGVADHTGLFGCRATNYTQPFLSYIENSYGGSNNVIRVDIPRSNRCNRKILDS